MSPGPWQIVIIAVVILLLFGASRIADIGKGLGEGIRNFKKGLSDDGDSEKLTGDEDEEPKQLEGKAKKKKKEKKEA